jgi:hypothetical protein
MHGSLPLPVLESAVASREAGETGRLGESYGTSREYSFDEALGVFVPYTGGKLESSPPFFRAGVSNTWGRVACEGFGLSMQWLIKGYGTHFSLSFRFCFVPVDLVKVSSESLLASTLDLP